MNQASDLHVLLSRINGAWVSLTLPNPVLILIHARKRRGDSESGRRAEVQTIVLNGRLFLTSR
jgi:hypothetical protein